MSPSLAVFLSVSAVVAGVVLHPVAAALAVVIVRDRRPADPPADPPTRRPIGFQP